MFGVLRQVSPTVHRYEVPGLLSGAQYMFRVRPVNRAGVGEGIEFDEPITVSSPYSKSVTVSKSLQ